jgi:hypothetical protein
MHAGSRVRASGLPPARVARRASARQRLGRASMRSPDIAVKAQLTADGQLALPVKLFLCVLIVPWLVPVGPLAMTVYRLVLIAMFLPCM